MHFFLKRVKVLHHVFKYSRVRMFQDQMLRGWKEGWGWEGGSGAVGAAAIGEGARPIDTDLSRLEKETHGRELFIN